MPSVAEQLVSEYWEKSASVGSVRSRLLKIGALTPEQQERLAESRRRKAARGPQLSSAELRDKRIKELAAKKAADKARLDAAASAKTPAQRAAEQAERTARLDPSSAESIAAKQTSPIQGTGVPGNSSHVPPEAEAKPEPKPKPEAKPKPDVDVPKIDSGDVAKSGDEAVDVATRIKKFMPKSTAGRVGLGAGALGLAGAGIYGAYRLGKGPSQPQAGKTASALGVDMAGKYTRTSLAGTKTASAIAEYSQLFDAVAQGQLGDQAYHALEGVCARYDSVYDQSEKTASFDTAADSSYHELDARTARLDQLLRR